MLIDESHARTVRVEGGRLDDPTQHVDPIRQETWLQLFSPSYTHTHTQTSSKMTSLLHIHTSHRWCPKKAAFRPPCATQTPTVLCQSTQRAQRKHLHIYPPRGSCPSLRMPVSMNKPCTLKCSFVRGMCTCQKPSHRVQQTQWTVVYQSNASPLPSVSC